MPSHLPTASSALSNLDEKRCGVCGSIMKLSKKDRKAGKTLEFKLRQHMKIHDKEQNKRKTRMAQGGKGKGKKSKLNAKEMKKFI